ncbi:helix-turn-helix domain-containing protein [Terriglobus sp.]|uniref:helix-turn-helix domain-containing protein n=1 Tax=Terriglobus sp. TaxID=1889013 RepID=UPI003B006E9C
MATLEKMQLHELRKLRRHTQKELSSATGIAQSEISRIETRTNLSLNTLDAYVRGLGGHLEVRAIFPEQTIAIDVSHGQASSPEESKAA